MPFNKKRIKASEIDFKEQIIGFNKVTKVVEGGRTFSIVALAVAGNGKGILGYGTGKSKDLASAAQKATVTAKKNLISIPILRGTIPHHVQAKHGGATVKLMPATKGTGLKAGGAVRQTLKVAGVPNIISKISGTSTPQNVVKATFKALAKLRDPLTIARQRNVSLNVVFNG